MSAFEQLLARFVCKEGDSAGLFNSYALITSPEKQMVSGKQEKDRYYVTVTEATPSVMGFYLIISKALSKVQSFIKCHSNSKELQHLSFPLTSLSLYAHTLLVRYACAIYTLSYPIGE